MAHYEYVLNRVTRYRRGELSADDLAGDALTVSIRSDWLELGDELYPAFYEVQFKPRGRDPIVRITGELGQYKEPVTARLEYLMDDIATQDANTTSEWRHEFLDRVRRKMWRPCPDTDETVLLAFVSVHSFEAWK